MDINAHGRLAYSIKQAAVMVGLGKSKLYELIRAGELPTVMVGNRRLVRAEALSEFLRAREVRA